MKEEKNYNETQNDQELRAKRSRRVYIVYNIFGIVFLLACLCIVGKVSWVNTVKRDFWLSIDQSRKDRDRQILPQRGIIYSSMGTAMAVTVPKYMVRIDFKARGFRDSLYLANVDSMAVNLADIVGGWSKATYKSKLKEAYQKTKGSKSRIRAIVPYPISYHQREQLFKTPYFRIRNNNITGYTEEEVVRRIKPYGNMASRTIGFLSVELDKQGLSHGSSGLEMQYDSLLCGVPGTYALKRVSGRYVKMIKKKPQNGCDIHTTLDVNIQDVTEKALLKKLKELDAAWGTAVVMKVSTGEIKAMSNLDRIREGVYEERVNHALRDRLEPGSTIKTISILAAMEDGHCNPDDPIDVGNGIWYYAGNAVKDHNIHRGGYGLIDVKKSIWFSSNVGVAKAVTRGYGDNRKAFRDRIVKMGLLDPIKVEIPGTALPVYKKVDQWRNTTMAWISFGYESGIPPIYMLRFYNGIANGGKMMQPYLVRKLSRNGEILSETKPQVLRDQMASKQHIRDIQEMLRGVVLYGTGQPLKDSPVQIAGKTGTAYVLKNGRYTNLRNLTFCGYFPYDDPQYSAIVVVSEPKGGHSADVSGKVIEEIAQQIQSTTMYNEINEIQPDSLETNLMGVWGGRGDVLHYAHDLLLQGNKVEKVSKKKDWYVYQTDSLGNARPEAIEVKDGLVPRLTGLMPMDACYLAGKVGLSVQIRGSGRVVKSQSLQVGHKVRNGEQIILSLGD